MGNFLEYLSLSWDHVLELAIGHALVVAISLAIDIVIGVSLGVLVYRRESAANVALAITSTFLTIPSFALFALFIPIFGLGYLPAIVALVMYGLRSEEHTSELQSRPSLVCRLLLEKKGP